MKAIAVALGVLALHTLPALAQTPTPRPSPTAASIEKQLIGVWEGPYQSEQAPPGSLRLTLAKEGATWKPAMVVIAENPIEAGEITEFKLEGQTMSWTQVIMDMTCHAIAELVNGTLKGESSCEQGGQVAITASWVLLKK